MSAPMEASLLGALLDAEGPVVRSNAGALVDRSGLRPEDLTDRRVSTAWAIVQRLVNRRRPVDARLVHAAGLASKLFTETDLHWLQGLQSANDLDAERFADLAETVRSMARSQGLAQVLERAIGQLKEPNANVGHVASAIEAALREAVALTATDSDGATDVMELASDWEAVEGPEHLSPIVPTGITSIDEVIRGWVPNLNVMVGLPSVGKSALLASMIDAQLEAGFKVGLFGLEDGTKWGPKRVIARDMQMAVRDVTTTKRTPEQALRSVDVMAATAARWKNCTTFTHDSITTDELCRRITKWVLEKGVQCIYIDHIGEVDHSNPRMEDFRLQNMETWRRLRNLAIRYTVPIVVLSHTGRPNDDNEERPPQLKEIAESSYAERKARVALGVWRRFEEKDVMRVAVLKQTEGEANVHLKLQRHTTAALVDQHAGERVNLFAEKMAHLRAQKEKRDADKLAMAEKARAVKEAAREAKEAAKKEKAQLAFGGAS